MKIARITEVQHNTLIILAAVVWFAGVIILLIKSFNIANEVFENGAPLIWVVSALFVGLTLGWIKSRYLFIRICKKNINRIRSLDSPRIWQFYRNRFYFFLFCMILFGNLAYDLVRTHNYLLLALAVLELSISTALFLSSKSFSLYYKPDPVKPG